MPFFAMSGARSATREDQAMNYPAASRGAALGLQIGMAASTFFVASAAFLPAAHACGGFFCSQAAPVNQSAEQIIFVENGDDTVTAVIRINYQGPSEHFAWVLPIAGVPDKVDVSSNQAFDRLSSGTAPQYSTSVVVEGTCKAPPFGNDTMSVPGTASGGFADAGLAADGSVAVLGMGSVGPYDWHVIAVSPNAADPAQDAVDWLTMNGYDVTDLGPMVLEPYLKDGLNLIAFKLTKPADAQSGSIRPVMLTFDGRLPSIPIRPTAVAAQDDMGVLVWVLSDKQAVPSNYKSLVLNEALINWFNYQSTYDAVVSAAADEAGGQGFVTEMAGPSTALDQVVWASYEQQQWQSYAATTFQDGFDEIMQAYAFRDWDGYRDAIFDSVTLPDGVAFDDFGRNPEAYRDMVQIDQQKFLVELYENVVRPVIKTQELLDSRGYVTRLYSTMSADEMTVDPVFDFNADLADLSNLHTAIQTIECSPSVLQYEAPWRIELPQGGVIRGKGNDYTWPFTLGGDLPANLKIVELSRKGQGKIAIDNSADIAKTLFKQSGMESTGAATPPPPPRGVPIGGGGASGSTSNRDAGATGPDTKLLPDGGVAIDHGHQTASANDDGGCSAASNGASHTSSGVLIALALMWLLPRRRKARR
jgi:uncharacterized protein (TIGR03382 family)